MILASLRNASSARSEAMSANKSYEILLNPLISSRRPRPRSPGPGSSTRRSSRRRRAGR
jgi:hypothetical protein